MKAILTYHSIDISGSVISVDPDRFRAHMDLLASRGTPVVPLERLVEESCVAGTAITFDDAFQNFATDAWPILRSHGFPVTLFVVSGWVGRDNGWDAQDSRIPRLPLLGWDALSELAREGVAMGSHTRSHPRLTSVDDGCLLQELVTSRSDLGDRLGVVPETLAYPYGDVDARVTSAAAEAGYSVAVGTELGSLPTQGARALELPRLDAYYLAKPGVMEAWGTPAFTRYMSFRRAARRVRASLRAVGLAR